MPHMGILCQERSTIRRGEAAQDLELQLWSKSTETPGFKLRYFPQKAKIIPWDAEAELL